MLAERKKRVKWSLNPRGNLWSQDSNKFGQRMLEKMGWKAGSGLGANEQGITEHIKVSYKSDNKCFGYKEHGEEWIEQQSQFENLLAELSTSHNNSTPLDDEERSESLEQKSRLSRTRIHYQKFTQGKDLSNRSTEDLACILGVKKAEVKVEEKGRNEDVDPAIGEVNDLYGVTTIKGGSMNDYFNKIKNKSKSKIPGQRVANEEIELDNSNSQNCEANMLGNSDTTNCVNLGNINKEKEVKMLEDDLTQTSSKIKNIQKNSFNDKIQSHFKLEKKVFDGNMLQEQQTEVTSKKKKKKYNTEATAEGNINIAKENVNSKVDGMKIPEKKGENNNSNDCKIGNSLEAVNIEQINNMTNNNVANSVSSNVNQSSKRRKKQKSNYVTADDAKSMKIENELEATEINICKNKHKKKSHVSSDNDDIRNDDLGTVENRDDKTDTNALKKKKKHKSDKLCEEFGEFTNSENLELVENEIVTNAVQKKHKRKSSISKINDMTNSELSGTVENEVEISNTNALKKERKKKSGVIKVDEKVIGNEILVKSDTCVCKKKRKRKSDLSEENGQMVNGEILECVENEMDINNTNTLKKKRKEKRDMIEMNEVVGNDISEIVKNEIDLMHTNVLKEKKRKKKNVLEETGEIIIHDILETVDKEIDINTLKKQKRKLKNNILLYDEKVDEFKIVNNIEVDICKKKQKNNSHTSKEMSDIPNKHDTYVQIDNERIVDGGKTDLEKQPGNKLTKKSKKNKILDDETLTAPTRDEMSIISKVESVKKQEEDPDISSNQHENGYSRQSMKISEFKKLLDPSLINFHNSNLHKIKGYGCILEKNN